MSDENKPGDAMLSALLRQAHSEGASIVTLRALWEDAAEAGATCALARLGLADRRASADISELRELLSAWRDVRRTARNAMVGWLVRLMLAGLLIGLTVKLKLLDWGK